VTVITINFEVCGNCCSSGFPGAQPVSMDCQNISLLVQRPYKVSWKADGTRYVLVRRIMFSRMKAKLQILNIWICI